MTVAQKRLIREACLYTKTGIERYEERQTFLSDAFLRPPYQYTSLENDTITKTHEDYDDKKIMQELHRRGIL